MSHHRVRVRKADTEVEVESTDLKVLDKKFAELAHLLGLPVRPPSRSERAPRRARSGEQSGGRPESIVEHVRKIRPETGTQYVVAVGHYLETLGAMSEGFKTRNITQGFRDLRYKHSNPAEAVRQARSQGYLMDASGGAMQLTTTALAWVERRLQGDPEPNDKK